MSTSSLTIDDALQARLGHLAAVRHRSTETLMHEAIEQYVSREEQREAFKQEALAAWQDYQDTGLHVTGDELARWLQSWGTDAEDTAPRCHE